VQETPREGSDTRECILDVAEVAVPNYNKQWKAFDPIDLRRSLATAHDAARRALELVDGASSVEQALIRPLAKRYPSNDPEKVTPTWNDDYANQMREVYCAHQDDHDVAALFAEAGRHHRDTTAR
jgi:hypothetical protein